MIYRSNLTCPDLTPYFKLRNPPLQILGHDIPSDPDFDPDCGYLSHDEAAILFHIGKRWMKYWVDLGARFGWSSLHLMAAGAGVEAVDPVYESSRAYERFRTNIRSTRPGFLGMHGLTTEGYFSGLRGPNEFYDPPAIDAALIDACHDAPEPTLDAQRAIAAGAKVLVWHDFQGLPIRQAVSAVMDSGWKVRVYDTPNGMAAAWDTPDFTPPDHVPDPAINWADIRSQQRDFDFSRCS